VSDQLDKETLQLEARPAWPQDEPELSGSWRSGALKRPTIEERGEPLCRSCPGFDLDEQGEVKVGSVVRYEPAYCAPHGQTSHVEEGSLSQGKL